MPAQLYGVKRVIEDLKKVMADPKSSTSQKLKAASIILEIWKLNGTKSVTKKPNFLLGIKK